MIGFVWLLLLDGVVGTSYPFSVWEAHLKSVDPFVPFPTARNSKICFFFDISHTCSAEAAALLGLGSPVDFANWMPGDAECKAILEGQRAYLEGVASSLFATAITRAHDAGVPNFELLTQSWVLRVGHFPLNTDYSEFVGSINDITDWSSVRCYEGNLQYEGRERLLPVFVGTVDCDILGYLQTCRGSDCLMTQAIYCCNNDAASTCCGVFSPNFLSLCQNAGCQVKDFCCSQDSSSSCCA